jgi:hypothetical protein
MRHSHAVSRVAGDAVVVRGEGAVGADRKGILRNNGLDPVIKNIALDVFIS